MCLLISNHAVLQLLQMYSQADRKTVWIHIRQLASLHRSQGTDLDPHCFLKKICSLSVGQELRRMIIIYQNMTLTS